MQSDSNVLSLEDLSILHIFNQIVLVLKPDDSLQGFRAVRQATPRKGLGLELCFAILELFVIVLLKFGSPKNGVYRAL